MLGGMKRRTFLSLASAAALRAAPAVNKRERMLTWLEGKGPADYTPAAFFLHFGDGYKNGSAATQKHLEFFHHTNMDFVKIQFEQSFTRQDFLVKPADWSKLQVAKIDFYEPLLKTVRELVKAEKKNSLILMTLYSPFMEAGHVASAPVLMQHMHENPEAVKKGLEILTESQMVFVRACIREGVDGFYASTQGGEASRLGNSEFTKYVKPSDMVAMKEAAAKCPFNILHVCDYVAPYSSYAKYTDYPGHVVNCNVKLANSEISGQDVVELFRRPFMGGMDRHGIIATGTPAQVEAEVQRAVKNAPKPFLLGADCTVDSSIDWDRLKHAISVAHGSAA